MSRRDKYEKRADVENKFIFLENENKNNEITKINITNKTDDAEHRGMGAQHELK